MNGGSKRPNKGALVKLIRLGGVRGKWPDLGMRQPYKASFQSAQWREKRQRFSVLMVGD